MRMIIRISTRRKNALDFGPETAMTTMTTAPLASLLDRLFAEADAASAATDLADLSDEERARLMRSKTADRDFYRRLKDVPLAVSRETATLLYMLARGT